MEEEWEAFIAEAKARGYGSSSEEDEPLNIIPRAAVNVSKSAAQNTYAGPEDAEEAVRSAGLGMSSLSIDSFSNPSSKKHKNDTNTPSPTSMPVPIMTPALYGMLSPPRQELFFNELAVVGSVGMYPPKYFSVAVTTVADHSLPASTKKMPSSMFLNASTKHSIVPLVYNDHKSQVCMSFGHLFCLCAAMPMAQGTAWMMQVEKSSDGRLVFKQVSVSGFGDRAAGFLSLYLPSLHELLGVPMECSTSLTISEHSTPIGSITLACPLHLIALLIPGSPFAESFLALTAMLAPSQQLSVGRLDAMTGSVHQVQSATLDISKSAAVNCIAYLLQRLLTLPIGDYILVHRRGADNIIVTRERECDTEIVFEAQSVMDQSISLEQINMQ